MTAAFIGQQRSIKARMLNDANTVNAMFNASVLAYAKVNRVGWGHQFRLAKSTKILKRVQPIDDDRELDDDTPAGHPEPDDSDPRKWWRYISQFKCRLPDKTLEANANRARLIVSPRQGTVGEHLRQWAQSIST